MTSDPSPTFAQLLRQARRQAGFTQEELAERAGISPNAISNLERGINRAPRRDTLDLLFSALDLTQEQQVLWERTRSRFATRSDALPTATSTVHGPAPHLPAPLTSFLGRDREVAELRRMLAASRLVTITGSGGVGKTRLGIAVAGLQREQYPDGIYFVSLAAVEHPDLVITAVLRALGLDETGERTPTESVSRFMQERTLLLLLDNFEHLVDAAPLVSHLLATCPQIKVLVTSRVPLRLSGEHEYPLRPLTESASTALFLERSREILPDFAPDDDQTTAIGEICRRLDGLPLAIELAAARSRLLPPHTLLEKLDHPLAILAGGPRDAPARQQTLRDTIAWSYDLLDPADQALFQALAVFRDGWSLEAAEAVCPDEIDVLNGLTTLIESNLIEVHAPTYAEPRFRMLETIREFGMGLLEADSSAHAMQERHARYISSVVNEVLVSARGPRHVYWLDRLETENANIQAALDWFLIHDVEAGLWMAGALYPFWFFHNHLTVGWRYYERLLAVADDSVDPVTMASVLTGAGILVLTASDRDRDLAKDLHERALSIWLDQSDPPEGAYWSYICLGLIASRQGNQHESEFRYQEALAYAHRHNQPYGALHAHIMLAIRPTWQGRFDEAESHYKIALSLAHEFDDPWAIAVSSTALANVFSQQERYDEAWPLLGEGLRLSKQLKHHGDIAFALDRMAAIKMKRGNLAEAKLLLDEALEASIIAGHSLGIGNARLGLGKIALAHGDTQHALALMTQALDNFLSAGNPRGIADSVDGLATLAAHIGNPERAVQLHAAVITFCEQVRITVPQFDRSALENEYITKRNALTPEAFEDAVEAGSLLTPDQIKGQLPDLVSSSVPEDQMFSESD